MPRWAGTFGVAVFNLASFVGISGFMFHLHQDALKTSKADTDRQIADGKADTDRQIADGKADTDRRIADGKAETDRMLQLHHLLTDRIIGRLEASAEQRIRDNREDSKQFLAVLQQGIAATSSRVDAIERAAAEAPAERGAATLHVMHQLGRGSR